MSKKAFAYLSVPMIKSAEYYEKTKSYKNQVATIQNYCTKKGHLLIGESIGCNAYLVDSNNSADIDELMVLLNKGKFEVVVVDKLERFSNNVFLLLELICKLKDFGIEFESASSELGTSSFIGRSNLFSYLSLMEFRRGLVYDK